MITSMGHHIFRGQHEHQGTLERYDYRVFVDPGLTLTHWRACVYRSGDAWREFTGALAHTSTGIERVQSIAQTVEGIIDAAGRPGR